MLSSTWKIIKRIVRSVTVGTAEKIAASTTLWLGGTFGYALCANGLQGVGDLTQAFGGWIGYSLSTLAIGCFSGIVLQTLNHLNEHSYLESQNHKPSKTRKIFAAFIKDAFYHSQFTAFTACNAIFSLIYLPFLSGNINAVATLSKITPYGYFAIVEATSFGIGIPMVTLFHLWKNGTLRNPVFSRLKYITTNLKQRQLARFFNYLANDRQPGPSLGTIGRAELGFTAGSSIGFVMLTVKNPNNIDPTYAGITSILIPITTAAGATLIPLMIAVPKKTITAVRDVSNCSYNHLSTLLTYKKPTPPSSEDETPLLTDDQPEELATTKSPQLSMSTRHLLVHCIKNPLLSFRKIALPLSRTALIAVITGLTARCWAGIVDGYTHDTTLKEFKSGQRSALFAGIYVPTAISAALLLTLSHRYLAHALRSNTTPSIKKPAPDNTIRIANENNSDDEESELFVP